MKREYITPECELIQFKLTRDILGDSQPEPSETINYNDPEIDPEFD